MSDSVITVNNLVKEYGSGAAMVKALRGVDLEITRGSFTCIVGPSGHGKSTLMHILGGLDHPTSGDVMIDGRSMVKRFSSLATRIWRVFVLKKLVLCFSFSIYSKA
jgi:putative ABC transport system ATP-binding protein